ncbi:hypothetical protein [Streptacidiphilus monticola]|uniref:Uncharacterized protein n=1 Tax=Streptacidiphilus monticola TaxID=2161674 RepID=A0ABW1GAD0_9ACTN
MNHRRPNPGELTPDDLFRPEPGPAAGDSAAEATQFLPPMPASPQVYPQQPYPQQQFPPAQPQQPYGQQPPPYPQQGYQQPYGAPAQTAYQQPVGTPAYDDEPPARRGPSTRAIAVGVVAVCAVLGIGMGLLMNGSGSATAGTTGSTATAQSTGSSAASAPAGTDPQAQALWGLLQNAASSRSAVVAAVENIGNCQNLAQAAQDLRQAAQQRRELINQLGQLQVDHLQQGSALADALRTGWTNSAQADEHYANWADANKDSCGHKKHHLGHNEEKQAGDAASGDASRAKATASRLWNAVAAANNLPKRSPLQL